MIFKFIKLEWKQFVRSLNTLSSQQSMAFLHDAFIQLPKDQKEYKKGENYPIIRYR